MKPTTRKEKLRTGAIKRIELQLSPTLVKQADLKAKKQKRSRNAYFETILEQDLLNSI